MTVLFIDIETRSVVELKKLGVYVYAEHPSTRVNCLSFALDDEPVATWFPTRGPMPANLLAALSDQAVRLVAHNAGFERTVLNDHAGRSIGVPHLALDRFDCTAALAASLGLPRSLDGVCSALDLTVQKDAEGKKVMLATCKPKRISIRKRDTAGGETVEQYRAVTPRLKMHARLNPEWVEDDETFDRLGAYCEGDVEAERAVYKRLPRMTPSEREIWQLTEEMNDRGVFVDEALVLKLLFLVEDAETVLNAKLREITGFRPAVKANRKLGIAAEKAVGVGAVCDAGAVKRWLQSFNVDDEAFEALGDDGVGKAALADMLARTDLPDAVRNVLLMRREGGKSSTAKYLAIVGRMSRDGTIKGSLMYAGAQASSRWSSKGVQMQNLANLRLLKKPREAIDDLLDGATLDELEAKHGPALVVASELLRPVFVAHDGSTLVRGDSSQIEARGLPWLAGAEWKLDAFRRYDAGTGPDLYCVTASQILNVPLQVILDDKKHGNGMMRQASGKVPELACGYGGGLGAFRNFAKIYGVQISDAKAQESVDAWRENNPESVVYWAAMEQAAIACLESPPDGRAFPVGNRGVCFKRNRDAMVLRLPSGHVLYHWYPRLKWKPTPWGDERLQVVYMGLNKFGQWDELSVYGGRWTAINTQAMCRDLMAYWLLRGRAAGLLPVLTVHDEGIFEARDDTAKAVLAAIMRTVPPWADGLPVNSDCSADHRYLKT